MIKSGTHGYIVLKVILGKKGVCKYVHSLLTAMKNTQRIETGVK